MARWWILLFLLTGCQLDICDDACYDARAKQAVLLGTVDALMSELYQEYKAGELDGTTCHFAFHQLGFHLAAAGKECPYIFDPCHIGCVHGHAEYAYENNRLDVVNEHSAHGFGHAIAQLEEGVDACSRLEEYAPYCETGYYHQTFFELASQSVPPKEALLMCENDICFTQFAAVYSDVYSVSEVAHLCTSPECILGVGSALNAQHFLEPASVAVEQCDAIYGGAYRSVCYLGIVNSASLVFNDTERAQEVRALIDRNGIA